MQIMESYLQLLPNYDHTTELSDNELSDKNFFNFRYIQNFFGNSYFLFSFSCSCKLYLTSRAPNERVESSHESKLSYIRLILKYFLLCVTKILQLCESICEFMRVIFRSSIYFFIKFS